MAIVELSIDYIRQKWQHVGFQKYFQNTGWMFAAQIISFLTSFFTVAIVARYLGPANQGMLNYAQSFVAIISVFASLGIDQILYRDLIAHPEKEKEYIGTAMYSKLVLGAIAFILSVVISLLVDRNFLLTILIGICALTFVVNPIGTVGTLFNAKVKSKYNSYITIFLAFFIPLLKLAVIFWNKGIIYFALIILVQAIVSTVWMVYIYTVKLGNNILSCKFHLDILKQLLRDSWPLLLAGFSGYIYANIDQVLLLHYIDSATVGIYGVAVKLTQVWAFLPGLLISSLFPAIVNAKKVNFEMYAKRFRALSGITLGATVAIALPLFIFAPFVIGIIFGNAYIGAVPILRIYLWVSVAITLVLLVQQYFITENFTGIFLCTSIIGAASNVILNVILIPRFGSMGSAWGTMISYLSVVASLFLFKKSRDGIISVFTK